MNPTLFFSICSLFYCVLLMFTIFSKGETKNRENKLLRILVLFNFGNLLLEAVGVFLGKNYENFKILNDISLRMMLVFYISWFTFFVLFIHNLANPVQKNKKYMILYFIMTICIGLTIFLPITPVTNKEGVIIYSTGPAVQVVYYYILGANIAGLYMMFKNLKKTKISHYASLFALIILSTLAATVQSYYPSLLLTASSETFVLYIAYLGIRKRKLDNNVNMGDKK